MKQQKSKKIPERRKKRPRKKEKSEEINNKSFERHILRIRVPFEFVYSLSFGEAEKLENIFPHTTTKKAPKIILIFLCIFNFLRCGTKAFYKVDTIRRFFWPSFELNSEQIK
jgi:hypothetical protein